MRGLRMKLILIIQAVIELGHHHISPLSVSKGCHMYDELNKVKIIIKCSFVCIVI